MIRQKIDIPALVAENRQIRPHGFGAQEQNQIRIRRQRPPARHEQEIHLRLQAQRVEIVEIRDMRQQGHGNPQPAGAFGAFFFELRRIFRRKFGAGGKYGTNPKGAQPVRAAMKRMPSANKAASPRSRLTIKPLMQAASSSASTAWVPIRLAITPPRSISPISTTGTPAARAKPILAISCARRLTSAALPAPSTKTRSLAAARI